MTRSLLRQRANLSIRTLIMIVLLELMNELGDNLVLTHWNIPAGTVKIHLVKLGVALLLAVPIMLVWLLMEYRRLQKAELTLQQSQQDYRSLFDHNPDGVYLVNENGEFYNANSAFLQMTGYTLDELITMSRLDFTTPENRNEMSVHLGLARNGESHRYETTLVTKDQRIIDVAITCFPMYREGQLTGSYGIVQDITERKRAARKLQETQNMLTSFLENTTDTIGIFDKNGNILRVNQGFTNMLKYEEQEILGKKIYELVPNDCLQDMYNSVSAVLHNQVVSSKDTVRLTKDGERVEVNTTVSPITNYKGEVVALATVDRDVTAEKNLIRDFERMHSRFESLIQNTADAISILDTQGKVILVNPAWEQLYGWKAAEIRRKISPALTEMFSRVIEYEQSFTEEQVKRRKDGTEVTVSATGSPIYSKSGDITGVSFISKDLTEQKKAEEIILNSEKLKLVASLAAGIAHEIRNPLTAVKGFLELMKTHYDEKYLDILQSEVYRINEITNEFLLLAKPQAQEKTHEDLGQILQEVLTLMETQTHMYSITVHVRVSNIVPRVLCVKSHVKQVFINIIKNAVEALMDGGNLFISLVSQNNGVSVQIIDDGPGMTEETLQRIGQPFYTTKERGSGLGLMVTYRIVENHGGQIHMSSTVGQGTRVQVYFPQDGRRTRNDTTMTAGMA